MIFSVVRKSLIPFLLFTSNISFAQQLNSFAAAPGKYKSLKPEVNEPMREEIFWTEDFSNGIPAGWINTESGGVASWMYRNEATTPNNEIGTQGSCIPEDSPGGAPIQSETWSNGFVIFDSNYWDDPIGPCGNLGSGPAPAPHLATLQLPDFDFTDYASVGIIFSQYTKNYEASSRVEVKVGNGPWIIVFENDLIVNQSSPLNDEQRVNITPQAAGQAQVSIRFVFEGTYYFWMLDDIKLVELDDNNMFARWSTFGDYDFYDPGHPTGFEFLEYHQYPDEMSPLLKFTTQAENYGVEAQTDVQLHVEIINEGTATEIHDGVSTESFTVQPGNEVELRAGDFQMPATTALYSVRYDVIQNEAEESPDDNRDTLNFRITDVVYARDTGPAEGLYLPVADFDGVHYEVGNMFLITENNIQAHSVTAGVSVGSSTPAEIYGAIYSLTIDSVITATLLGNTESVAITEDLLNDYGDEHLITMNFVAPITLENGHAYFVAAGSNDGPDQVLFSNNGASPEFATWMKFFPNTWFYLPEVAMVRLNIGPYVGVNEMPSVENTLVAFPNPTDGEVMVEIPKAFAGNNQPIVLRLTDSKGSVVFVDELKSTENHSNYKLNTSAFANGLYSLNMATENRTGHVEIVVNHNH